MSLSDNHRIHRNKIFHYASFQNFFKFLELLGPLSENDEKGFRFENRESVEDLVKDLRYNFLRSGKNKYLFIKKFSNLDSKELNLDEHIEFRKNFDFLSQILLSNDQKSIKYYTPEEISDQIKFQINENDRSSYFSSIVTYSLINIVIFSTAILLAPSIAEQMVYGNIIANFAATIIFAVNSFYHFYKFDTVEKQKIKEENFCEQLNKVLTKLEIEIIAFDQFSEEDQLLLKKYNKVDSNSKAFDKLTNHTSSSWFEKNRNKNLDDFNLDLEVKEFVDKYKDLDEISTELLFLDQEKKDFIRDNLHWDVNGTAFNVLTEKEQKLMRENRELIEPYLTDKQINEIFGLTNGLLNPAVKAGFSKEIS